MKEGTLPSREVELKLIETLRTITEGKIYVEVERARLTHRLASMQEEDGDLTSAAKTMQELQVGSSVDACYQLTEQIAWGLSSVVLFSTINLFLKG